MPNSIILGICAQPAGALLPNTRQASISTIASNYLLQAFSKTNNNIFPFNFKNKIFCNFNGKSLETHKKMIKFKFKCKCW